LYLQRIVDTLAGSCRYDEFAEVLAGGTNGNDSARRSEGEKEFRYRDEI
jgi:hypothetical protein